MTERRPLSRRQRRLRLTAALMAVAVVAGVTALAWRYHGARAGEYRPGEANPDITSSLARGLPPEAPKPQFTDVTAAAGLGAFRTFTGGRTSQLPEDMGSGAAWGDFDNDGDEDLFIVSAGGPLGSQARDRAPSLLLREPRGWPVPSRRGLPRHAHPRHGCRMGRFRWRRLDRPRRHRVRHDCCCSGTREAVSRRTRRFASRAGFWTGVAWGDYDRDGDLDLYVCGYVQYHEEPADRTSVSQHYGSSVPFTLNPASYDPERNLLFRNNGTGVFTEVGRALGVDNPEGRSLSARVARFRRRRLARSLCRQRHLRQRALPQRAREVRRHQPSGVGGRLPWRDGPRRRRLEPRRRRRPVHVALGGAGERAL